MSRALDSPEFEAVGEERNFVATISYADGSVCVLYTP